MEVMPCNHYHKPSNNILKCASTREIYQDMFDQYIYLTISTKISRRAPHYIVRDLLQSAYNVSTSGCREVLRDIVVLELLFSTGLQVSEQCALSKDIFLLKNGEPKLLVSGKGRKERILQITTPELLQVVQTQPKAAGRPAAFARTIDNTTLSIYLMRREDICIFPRRDTKHHCPINTSGSGESTEVSITVKELTEDETRDAVLQLTHEQDGPAGGEFIEIGVTQSPNIKG